MAEIKVENLKKAFGDLVAVRDSTFTVGDGEFFCLLGPSGCGKTTTLRMIAGLELPTSGVIRLAGDDVTFKRASERDIAMVFQLFALYPHMNVRKNISYPLTNIGGLTRSEISAKVEEAARILRITHLLDRPVGGLSGGDRQRVALGRAIVRAPKAFMMDEPLGALDSEFRHVMCGELRALHNRLKATTVYVTHDQLEAMSMADKIAVMNQGVIEQLSTPQEIYDRPATLFVADFIGQPSMNLVPFKGRIARGESSVALEGGTQDVPVVHEDGVEGELMLGIRPEHVRLSDTGALRGEIYGTEYLGTNQIVTVRTASGLVRARLPATLAAKTGSQVGLVFKPERISLFDRTTGRAVRTALYDRALRPGGGNHG
jgi:multiple sugar transport system ATP-binding protein